MVASAQFVSCRKDSTETKADRYVNKKDAKLRRRQQERMLRGAEKQTPVQKVFARGVERQG